MPDDPRKDDQPSAPSGDVTPEPAPDPDAGPRPLRLTRRRLLIVGGAALAGAAATVAGVKGIGGSAGGTVAGGDFPVLSVEPPPDVPADDWVLRVDGLVRTPLAIDRAAWTQLTRTSVTADFHCITGWTADDVRWAGVTPGLVLDRAGLDPDARAVVFHAFGHLGSGYTSSLPLEVVTAPDTLLADTLDGAPLPPEHGGPLRAVVPSQFGYKSVKWVVRIEVTSAPVPGYWEQRGYPQDAPVAGG